MSQPSDYNTGRWKCGGCDGWFRGSPPGSFDDPWLCPNCQALGRTDQRSEATKRDTIARKLLEQVFRV